MSELYHHGVKGMKWGVRKTVEKVGRVLNKQVTSKETDAKIKKATIALGAAAVTAALAAMGASPAVSLPTAVIDGGRRFVNDVIIGHPGTVRVIPHTNNRTTPFGYRWDPYIYTNRQGQTVYSEILRRIK